MKTPSRPVLARRSTLALGITAAALFTPAALFAQPTTGFNQTAAGPWNYNTPGNWVGGSINGVWDSSLSLSAAQVVTFDSDLLLSTGLTFGYAGTRELTLRSDGSADRTITLGGDITVAPVSNQTVTFGSATAGQGLNINLNGDRTFNVSASKTLRFHNALSGGDITINGNARTNVGGTVLFSGESAAAASSSIRVTTAGTLAITSAAGGAVRAQNVELAGGGISFTGNAGGNTTETISGNLTVAPGRNNNVTLVAGLGTHLQLNAANLQRSGTGAVLFRGTDLGVNAIASATANSTNIAFTSAPALVGGAHGTKGAGILPWAVVDTSATGLGSSFATYDATNGIRALNASEYSTTIAFDDVGTTEINESTAGHNIKLTATGTPLTVNGATTVNSLFVDAGANGAHTALDGTGSLTVSSGAVFFNIASMTGSGAQTLTIAKNIDFGSTQGILGTSGSSNQRRISFSGGISGTGGLVFYDTGPNAGQAAGFYLAHANTYTGDTYINGTVTAATNNALANFSHLGRTGDIYLNGVLKLSAKDVSIQINGLWGSGTVHSEYTNSNKTLVVGDNNATSTFDGRLAGGNGSMNLAKIGTGTLTLTGIDSAYAGTTAVRNGTLSAVTLNSVVGGTATSSLGAPVTATDGTIALGSTTTTGTLRVTGTGETTDRIINLAGTTGGGGIEQAGTGHLTFTSDFTATGGGSKTLTLSGSTAGTGEIAGAIVDNSGTNKTSVTKSGTGTWILSGTNTYTGVTSVSAGTLLVSGSLDAGSAVAVASGAKFGGTGIANGAVTASAFDSVIIAGGVNSIGTLHLSGGLTATNGATFAFDINGASIDSIDFGSASLNLGGTVTFDFTSLGSVQTGFAYTLFAGTGDWSSITASFIINGPAGYELDTSYGDGRGYIFDDVNNSYTVQFIGSTVPEPSSVALLGGLGALSFAALRRRRSRVNSGV